VSLDADPFALHLQGTRKRWRDTKEGEDYAMTASEP